MPDSPEVKTERLRLQHITDNQPVTFIKMDTDRYGRTVARVFLKDGREINRLMIKSGTASEYMKYSKGFYSVTIEQSVQAMI